MTSAPGAERVQAPFGQNWSELLPDSLVQAGAENFPVASRLLPRSFRKHLLATYAYARLIDDIGDVASGDRLELLGQAEDELDAAFSGKQTHAVFANAANSAHVLGLSREPYVALIEANRMDQLVSRYADFSELEAYCALSANPVGRIALAVFDIDSEDDRRYSDRICTGLQLVEHWQDLSEDYRAGRIYLPQDDLVRFTVPEADLGLSSASGRLKRLMAFEANRARELIESGLPLIAAPGPFGRLAIAGFAGGGLAQIDAIERAKYDTLSHAVKAKKERVASKMLRLFLGIRRTQR